MRHPDETGRHAHGADWHPDEGTIHAWLDGALDPASAEGVETHVRSCASCAEAVAEARGLVAGASRIIGDLDAAGGVMPAIVRGGVRTEGSNAAAATADSPVVAPTRRFRRAERALAGLAAAAVIAAVGLTVARERPATRGVAMEAQPAMAIPGDSTVKAVDASAARASEATVAASAPAPVTPAAPPVTAATGGKTAQETPAAKKGFFQAAPQAPPVATSGGADATRAPGGVVSGAAAAEATAQRSVAEVRAAEAPARVALRRAVETPEIGAAAAPAAAAPAADMRADAPAFHAVRCYRVALKSGAVLGVRLGSMDDRAGGGAAQAVREASGGSITHEARYSGSFGGILLVEWREGVAIFRLDIDERSGTASLRGEALESGTARPGSCPAP